MTKKDNNSYSALIAICEDLRDPRLPLQLVVNVQYEIIDCLFDMLSELLEIDDNGDN